MAFIRHASRRAVSRTLLWPLKDSMNSFSPGPRSRGFQYFQSYYKMSAIDNHLCCAWTAIKGQFHKHGTEFILHRVYVQTRAYGVIHMVAHLILGIPRSNSMKCQFVMAIHAAQISGQYWVCDGVNGWYLVFYGTCAQWKSHIVPCLQHKGVSFGRFCTKGAP